MILFMDQYYDSIKQQHGIELSTMWKTRDPIYEQIMTHGPRKNLGKKSIEQYMKEETR